MSIREDCDRLATSGVRFDAALAVWRPAVQRLGASRSEVVLSGAQSFFRDLLVANGAAVWCVIANTLQDCVALFMEPDLSGRIRPIDRGEVIAARREDFGASGWRAIRPGKSARAVEMRGV